MPHPPRSLRRRSRRQPDAKTAPVGAPSVSRNSDGKGGVSPADIICQAADIFRSCACRRETLREPVFLWTTPLVTARISSDWAFTKASLAAAASPALSASSNLRRKVRTRERRAVLISVRRAILRTAFLEPGVLAIL